MISFEFVDSRGEKVLTHWQLDDRQKRAIRRKLALLERVDRRLAAGSILFNTKVEGVWEVEIRGNVQLRPMACLGPVDADNEVTFLARAEERNNRLVPPNVREIAAARLAELRKDPEGRREQVWPPSASA